MNTSARRNSGVETRPTGSKIQQTQRRPVKPAVLRVRENAAELARRNFLHLAAGAAALPAVSGDAAAQTYPSRPITMIDSFPAGGSTGTIARIVAERMGTTLRQPIIIENVGGANGSIGTGRVARARPDGYTVAIGTQSTHVLNGALFSLPYDVLNDFAPISPLVAGGSVLYARKTMPESDLNGLIAWLKSNPNKASAGIAGTSLRLLTAYFKKKQGRNSPLCPIVVARPRSRIWRVLRSTWQWVHWISYH
jgi:tripartite-type tricarboxylate transporter receptor subunit TctC